MFLSRNLKKISEFFSEIFQFLVVKFSIYLNRPVLGRRLDAAHRTIPRSLYCCACLADHWCCLSSIVVPRYRAAHFAYCFHVVMVALYSSFSMAAQFAFCFVFVCVCVCFVFKGQVSRK